MYRRLATALLIISAALATIGGCESDSPGPVNVTGVWRGTVAQGEVGFNVRLTLTQVGTDVTGTFDNLSTDQSTGMSGTHVSPDMTLVGGAIRMDVSVGTNVMTGRYQDARGVGTIELTRE